MGRRCLLAGTLMLAIATGAGAQVLYQTGFENPPFTVGPIAGQDSWNVFGGSAAVNIENSFAKSGTQAVLIDTTLLPNVPSNQTGPWRNVVDPSLGSIVSIDADVYLASSSSESSWQFAALYSNLGGFIAGFNVLPDGTLQLITPWFPITAPVVTRDTWMHYTLTLNFLTQTSDVYINGVRVAYALPFVKSATALGGFIFDTFGAQGGPTVNDQGYLDNLLIQTTGCPDDYASWWFWYVEPPCS